MLETTMPETSRDSPEAATSFGLLLVDDHPLFRESFGVAIHQMASHLDIETVATVDQAIFLLEGEPHRFDLVLLDYKMPGTTGLASALQLRQRFPDIGFGLISGEDVSVLCAQARGAGLNAFLSKSMEMDELMAALSCLARGDCYFHEAASSSSQRPLTQDFGLTERQMEVIDLLATGASNKVIAQSLGISPATVKNHLDAIFEKMGVSNRLQAVMLAKTLQR
jgi:two-component system, NarL family, nitrate/nitrite response regulator NarL